MWLLSTSGTHQTSKFAAGPIAMRLRVHSMLLLGCLVGSGCAHHAPTSPVVFDEQFLDPQRVTIRGYSGEAMEPFLSRDAKYMFFNNSNDSHVDTNLHWAEWIDSLNFQYKGELQGVNTKDLEGVPSMDRNGVFYFISNRSYKQTASTIYWGKFAAGNITGIEIVPGVSLAKPGVVNFDAEISADGNTLYFVDSQFSFFGHPKTARILIARRSGAGFARSPDGAEIMRQINSDSLNYAPAISATQLEIFFTRVTPEGPRIYIASRTDPSRPFGAARQIHAINAFAEGPTVAPDGKSLYYHQKDNKHFAIYRVTRQ
jgi:hypothetical protein